MSALVLQPAQGKTPGRMKQLTKDALRHWLVLAAERNEQLRGENLRLRQAGMLTFEAAFLPHILLPNGQTVIDHVQQQKRLPQKVENVR
jgi:hypothetical protein